MEDRNLSQGNSPKLVRFLALAGRCTGSKRLVPSALSNPRKITCTRMCYPRRRNVVLTHRKKYIDTCMPETHVNVHHGKSHGACRGAPTPFSDKHLQCNGPSKAQPCEKSMNRPPRRPPRCVSLRTASIRCNHALCTPCHRSEPTANHPPFTKQPYKTTFNKNPYRKERCIPRATAATDRSLMTARNTKVRGLPSMFIDNQRCITPCLPTPNVAFHTTQTKHPQVQNRHGRENVPSTTLLRRLSRSP